MTLPIPLFVRTVNGHKPHSKGVVRRIKYEHELDHNFGEEIASHAYGERLMSCIQCGTCSATCPVSHYMDYTPRKVIAMTREGFKEEVLNSLTIWLCASCYSCMVQCRARCIALTPRNTPFQHICSITLPIRSASRMSWVSLERSVFSRNRAWSLVSKARIWKWARRYLKA